MPDYNKACIYMIKHNQDYNDENVYIGSCCNFARRKYAHKNVCNNPNYINHNLKLYQKIRENGGWNEWVMIKLHNFPCNEKHELNLEERRVIDLYQSKLNIQLPSRTIKEWREENKEELNKKNKKYNEEHREYLNEKHKIYYENNKEKLSEKITCECGAIFRKDNISHHHKTKKHISFFDNMKAD